jgi:hypothetical protein
MLAWGILIQSAAITIPCAALVATGNVRVAAVLMWGMLALMAMRYVLLNRMERLACLLIAVAPMVNLLRGALFYSGVPLLFTGVLILYLMLDYSRCAKSLRNCSPVVWLLSVAGIYYAISFLITGEFRSNIRVLSLVCSAAIVVIIANRPGLLWQGLVGLVISAIAVGLGAYPHLQKFGDQRLGFVGEGDLALGNPFTLGMPLAFGVLAVSLDRGRWLGYFRHRVPRYVLILSLVPLLALSTSRTSWAVAFCGLGIGFLFAGRQRIRVISYIAVIFIGGAAAWSSPAAEPFRKGWERTFGDELTLNQISTGRSGQWRVFYAAWTDSPTSFLFGYGARDQREVFSEFSSEMDGLGSKAGANMAFHGMIMHIGVGFGLLGVAPLVFWLSFVCYRCYKEAIASQIILPLTCFVGFVVGSMTVSGFDTVSGTLLGVGLLSVRRGHRSIQFNRSSIFNRRAAA